MTTIKTLTLDRPDKGNALSADLVERLLTDFHHAVADPATLGIVIVGAGRNFCTGFDLSNLDTSTDGDLLLRFVRIEMLLDAVWCSPVPVTAVAQGRVWGAGADLFAACDHRVLAASANLRFPGAGFGLVLGTRRLACRVGTDHARRLTCEGETLNADAALACGLATQVLPQDTDLAEFLHTVGAPAIQDRHTLAALRRASLSEAGQADLAELVQSAARPGLKARIQEYRARQMSARQSPPQTQDPS